MFNQYIKEFDNNNAFVYFEIHDYGSDLIKHINKRISNLSLYSEDDLEEVKKDILRALLDKKKFKPKMGMVAEFFTQLFLDFQGFDSKYFFLNLEEDSYKKGFDGVFVKNSNMWIMESKSGSIDSIVSTHNDKIRKAYKDLDDKFSGKFQQNVWRNAFNHAALRDNKDSLLETIRGLKKEYNSEIFHNINDFNIIPSGTIFFKNNEINIDKETIEEKIIEFIKNKEIKNSYIICISNKSLENFVNYLKGEL